MHPGKACQVKEGLGEGRETFQMGAVVESLGKTDKTDPKRALLSP